MRMVKLILAVSVFFSAAVFADVVDTNVYNETKTAIVAAADKPEFVIKLKSNPTTGYSWFLRDYNSSLVEPVKHVYEAATDKKLIGAAGYEFWTFRVRSAALGVPQQTSIRFVYARPWQSEDSTTQKVFRVTTVDSK